MKKIILTVIILHACNLNALPSAEVSGNENQNPVLAGYTSLTVDKMRKVIEHFGLLYLNDYASADRSADVTFKVSLFIAENSYNALIEISGTDASLKMIHKKYRIRTRYIENIPLLAAREIIRLHENIPVIITAEKSDTDGYFSVSIGSATPGYADYLNTEKSIRILSSYPYRSLISADDNFKTGTYSVRNSIRTATYINEINTEIRKNIYENHRLNKKLDEKYSEHKFIEGLIITNPLGNVIAPGVGSYLSMKNLGIQKPDYSYLNICGTFSAAILQIFYVPYKNNFRFDYNFNDKSEYSEDYRYLQIYFLAALPFTFSASYLDHLALNCRSGNLLPPFFMQQDTAAASLSFFIPGGGYYLKGYRSAGLLMYSTQFAYGAYYFSNFSETSLNPAYIYGFIALRLIDIAGAYFINDNFGFYKDQINQSDTVQLYVNIDNQQRNNLQYFAGLTLNF
ncbi:MAG: hypothetical protein JW982_00505 [Spirochaetes bacterium]|nr:hypothetical protein [Spirochaetota bacterium]